MTTFLKSPYIRVVNSFMKNTHNNLSQRDYLSPGRRIRTGTAVGELKGKKKCHRA